jgi:CTP synthase (UTP-ammonia lyase)
MTTHLNFAVVGDRDDAIAAHRAIPVALTQAAAALDAGLAVHWVATDTIRDAGCLAAYDAFWIAPGSPYRSLDGALRAIGYARTAGRPLLGTCGGFQHALLEFARHVVGWPDAMHAESDPGVGRPVITALACSLVEARGSVTLTPGSRIARAYASPKTPAIYRCRYGLDPALREALTAGRLRGTGEDEHGELRAVELDDHPFFVATLWQPERAALEDERVPLAEALVRAAIHLKA